jgi:hypothetical protein
MNNWLLLVLFGVSLVMPGRAGASRYPMTRHPQGPVRELSRRLDGEFPLDTTVSYGPSTYEDQDQPAVASGGANFLAVWIDENAERENARAARVSQDGALLDSGSIDLPGVWAYDPRVAFGSGCYLVVWDDARNDSTEIYGARVAASGQLLDTAGILISAGTANHFAPVVAFNGTDFLVLWSGRNRTRISGARVAPSGQVIDTSGIVVEANYACDYDVASDGSDWLVVWRGWPNYDSLIHAVRINAQGVVMDTAAIAVARASGQFSKPSVAFLDSSYLVTWAQTTDTLGRVIAARVTPAGEAPDSSGIVVYEASGYLYDPPPVCRLGSNWLVVWQRYHSARQEDLAGARVNGAGQVLDPGGFAITNAQDVQWEAAAGGPSALCVWGGGRDSFLPAQVYSTRVNADATVPDSSGILVSLTTPEQTPGEAAFDGTNYFVTWLNTAGTRTSAYGTRLTQAGQILDGTPIPIALDYASEPVVAFNGLDYLVVWTSSAPNDTDICGARVSPDGVVLDSGGFVISSAPGYRYGPQVEQYNGNWLVAWTDRRNANHPEVYACRVTGSGYVLDSSGIRIASGQSGDVTSGSDNWFVTWFHNDTILAARVSATGQVLDPDGMSLTRHAVSSEVPTAVFDGADYFVVWADSRNGTSAQDIFGTRVSAQGVVIDSGGIPVVVDTNQNTPRAMVRNQGENVLTYMALDRRSGKPHIIGVRLRSDGSVVGRLAVFPDFYAGDNALASGSGSSMFVGTSTYLNTWHGRNYNAARAVGKLGPLGGIKGTPVGPDNNPPELTLSSNPGRSAFRFIIQHASPHSLVTIYDATGRAVRTLHPAPSLVPSVPSVAFWNGTDNSGTALAPGAYFARLSVGVRAVATREVMLVR